MSEDPTTNIKKLRRKFVIACVITDLFIYFFLVPYLQRRSMDVLLILACNALLVNVIYKPASREEKIRLWLKTSCIIIFSVLGLYMLIEGAVTLAFIFGGKVGG